MARPGDVEDRLWDQCTAPDAPDLVLLTGSAGCGKTATIGHLLDRNSREGLDRFGEALADATHSDSPDEEQVGRLARFFAPFADGNNRPGGPTRLVAINTGMVMKFFSDLSEADPGHDLRALETYLRHCLRLPGAATAAPPHWMSDAVVVVNLDLRPTAGTTGDVFDLILTRLNPADPDGVLGGTPRCATCKVVDWCWPMANATTLSGNPGRSAVNKAAGTASLRRGRELPPRALWDAAAELALSGLVTIPGQDPCARIAQVAQDEDYEALLNGLACHSALQNAKEGTLLDEIATADPTFQAGHDQHAHLSRAGLNPPDDARLLTNWLTGATDNPHASTAANPASGTSNPIVSAAPTTTHPAVRTAAVGIDTRATTVDPRAYARAAWLGGAMGTTTASQGIFEQALDAQARGASAHDDGPDGEALRAALYAFNDGLTAGFGVLAGVETYFPTEGPGPRQTDVFVRADLIAEEKLWTSATGDPARHHNPTGADIVGYRELTLALAIRKIDVPVDYPLWELLEMAVQGSAPSTVDLDRYLALRRAIESIGREAGNNQRVPLLVVDRSTGRRYRVAPFGPTSNLRATEVE